MPEAGDASLAQQLERLNEADLGGIIPLSEYRRRRAEVEARVEALGRQESSLAGEAQRLDQGLGLAASLESFCERVLKGLEGVTFDRKRRLVELLIDRVIVTGDQVEIRYAFPTSPESEYVRFYDLRSDYLHHPAELAQPAAAPLYSGSRTNSPCRKTPRCLTVGAVGGRPVGLHRGHATVGQAKGVVRLGHPSATPPGDTLLTRRSELGVRPSKDPGWPSSGFLSLEFTE